jgi:hypothetical protein
VDFRSFKAEGVRLVIAKCTEVYPDGSIERDPDYDDYRAETAGIGARFAAYNFAHPGGSAATAWDGFREAAALRAGDIPVIDLEVSDGQTVADVAAWGSAYSHACYGATGTWPWAYSDQAFLRAGNLDGCKVDPLWVAVLTSGPMNAAPYFPGFRTVAVQWKWGDAGVADFDEVYLSEAELAALAIRPPVVTPSHLVGERERQIAADLGRARAELARIARLSGWLGFNRKAARIARRARQAQVTGPLGVRK